MDDILLRPVTKEDHPQIKQILCDIWHFDRYMKSDRSLALLLDMLLHSYYYASNYTQAAVKDGKILGFVFGNSNKRPARRNSFLHLLGVTLDRLRLTLSPEGREGLAVQIRISRLGGQLMEHREGQFDGELVLFATAQQVRGQGIGKKLLFAFNDYLRDSGAKFIYLMSDSFCNYGFYEHLGYRRIATKRGLVGVEENEASPSEFYLYAYEVYGEDIIANKNTL